MSFMKGPAEEEDGEKGDKQNETKVEEVDELVKSTSDDDEVKTLVPGENQIASSVEVPLQVKVEGDGGESIDGSETGDEESRLEKRILTPVESAADSEDVVTVDGVELALGGVQPNIKEEEQSPENLADQSVEETDTKEGESEEVKVVDEKAESNEGPKEDLKEDATENARGGEGETTGGEAEVKEEEKEESKDEAEAEETPEAEAEPEPSSSVFGEDVDWGESLLEDQDPESMLDDSPSRLEWLRQKREQNETNEHLDRMMSMIGHEGVKEHFLAIKTKVEVAKRWGEDLKELNLDLLIHGRSGTGKKRIAQIYAEFLYSIGAVCRRSFRRTIRYYMPPEGDQTVVFFSEGDDVNQDSEIVNILEKVNESKDKIVLILAYRDHDRGSEGVLKSSMEARRRFPEPIPLNNHNDKDARQLVRRLIEKRKLEIEGGLNDAVVRYLAWQSLRTHVDDSNYKNIHTLAQDLDLLSVRQALRYEKDWVAWAKSRLPPVEDISEAENPVTDDRPKKGVFTDVDIFGPEPTDARNNSAAWKELQQMVGLESVKKEIGYLYSIAKVNYYRGIHGKDPIPVKLNRVFVGDSGVGKTTVAQIYGRILGELGLVSKGQVFLKNPSHLLGTTYGSSEKKTREALDNAMGSTLIIDDAHMLFLGKKGDDSDVFRLAIIDTLVANILGKAGEDRCVILVGYKDKMEKMLLKSNPGLQRRFPLDDALHFEGYNEDQLCGILDAKLAEDEVVASDHALSIARELLGRARTRPRFGNGGDVENLLERAKIRQRQRLEAAGIDRIQMLQEEHPLEAEDFDPDYDRASRADGNRDALFDEFVGFGKITKQFQEYQQMANGLRRLKIDPRTHIPWAFVFKGPPGTGKTSTARKVGKLFYDMGFLATDEVVDCSVTDLVGSYQGHTGPKVINQLELGLGKVLFIDEAYRLAPGGPETSSVNFKNEAIGEIVDAMTKPRYAGNMVIILAGYTEDMEYLLRSNQGLRSRFPTHVTFPHMEPQSCLALLKQQLGKLKISIEIPSRANGGDDKIKKIYRMFAKLSMTKGWANGRDIETLGKNIVAYVFMNVGKMATDQEVGSLNISADELINFLKDMLRSRKSAEEDEES